MFYRDFRFGRASGEAGATNVSASDLYGPERGYGFLTEQNRREQELLRIPELNTGFDTFTWYKDRDLSRIGEDENGCFLDSDALVSGLQEESGHSWKGEHRRIPLSFAVDVPRQGNYRVTYTLRTKAPLKDLMIFTGRRRLAYRGDVGADTVFTLTMIVNVCDIIPRGQTGIYADTTVDITIVADRPAVSELLVEETACPVVYIAGDSTVTDQSAEYPYAPGTSYSGWGQMLTAYMNEKAAVSNHAHSGLTTESFRKEGHYGIVERYGRSGDFFFFQFAHNDQKLAELKAREGYRDNLLRYISECREKGGYPVLVTPLARNTWRGNDGSYNDLLEEYAAVCLEIGKETDVPVLDLHRYSMEFVKQKGLEGSKPYFFPDDYTHTNDYGAYYMAGVVASEIQKICGGHKDPAYRYLADCMTEGCGTWDPPEEIVKPVRPADCQDAPDPELLPELDRPDEPADRVAVLDLLIRTARFFPTNVYNDFYTDVVGHEWYAGIVECACQNGMIDSGLAPDGRLMPLQAVTLEEFLVFAMNGYKSRKTLPAETPCAYDGSRRKFARPYVRAACSLGLIAGDGSEELSRIVTRGEIVTLCRKMNL